VRPIQIYMLRTLCFPDGRIRGHGRLHAKRFRHDLGVYGMTIGYAAARAEAERIISEARNGRDP
jgi:hypothetical protein